jgi:hypothetical protein
MYSWQLDYIAALLEVDESKANRRLYEAISAIEQRLLAPLEAGSADEVALRQAQRVIAVLRERPTDLESVPPDS